MNKGFLKGIALFALVFGMGAMTAACGNRTDEEEKEKVVWTGIEDIELNMGDQVPDLLEGVTATQGKTALTVKIDEERSDEVSTDSAGAFSIYYVAYRGTKAIAEDLDGEQVRTVTVTRGTYIDNYNFESSSTQGWRGNGNGNSKMTWRIDTDLKACVVEIEKSGDEYWQNQVEYNGLSVKAHTTYVVNIRAKSTTPRNIGASLEVPSLGYECIDTVSVNSVGYTMTSDYADYKFYYTAKSDYDGVKLGIILGRFNELDETENTVYIDSVRITKLEKEANTTGVIFTGQKNVTISDISDYLALDPVTAVDKDGNPLTLIKEGAVQTGPYNDDLGTAVFGEMWKYVDPQDNLSYFRRQIAYRAPAPERLHDYDTLDGDFEYGVKFWNTEENDIVKIEPNKIEQIIEISSVKTPPSGEPDWRAQLQQNANGGKLTANKAYKMVVEAKIDNINLKTLRLEFCAPVGGPKNDMVFSAADTYQTFESTIFQPSSDVTGGNYRIGLLIGEYREHYKLTVKSIHVVEVEGETPYIRETEHETMNGDFALGLKYWTVEGDSIAVTANSDNTIKVASTMDAHTAADWTAQVQQNSNGGKLTAGNTYKATVKAKTSNKDLKTLRLEFCAAVTGHEPKVDLVFAENDTYQVFETATFTPTEDVTGANYRVGLLLGEYASPYELIVDYIQIVKVN